eukprot:TRINITY_DN1160_c1_g1_i2.p1 TRINITY_DN1160_c1_g1~~TRINITY_DN1160_c1_g1_i2.p1  ORF type:complete len:1072 (+),score=346.63 TRINITY_DN1160_c1_g1_i2:180-3395(+)
MDLEFIPATTAWQSQINRALYRLVDVKFPASGRLSTVFGRRYDLDTISKPGPELPLESLGAEKKKWFYVPALDRFMRNFFLWSKIPGTAEYAAWTSPGEGSTSPRFPPMVLWNYLYARRPDYKSKWNFKVKLPKAYVPPHFFKLRFSARYDPTTVEEWAALVDEKAPLMKAGAAIVTDTLDSQGVVRKRLRKDLELVPAKAGAEFDRVPPMSPRDLFTTDVYVGKQKVFKADPHWFEPEYSFNEVANKKLPNRFLYQYNDILGYNQRALGELLPPGHLAIIVKHDVPFVPQVNLFDAGMDKSLFKRVVKLFSTHVGMAVGINYRPPSREQNFNGITVVHSPRNYPGEGTRKAGWGFIGSHLYPAVLIEPTTDLTEEHTAPLKQNHEEVNKMFRDNIRTWLVLANVHISFPVDTYNGDDRLSVRNEAELAAFRDLILRAVVGDTDEIKQAARDELQEDKNKMYCSEFLHLVLNLGIHFPLNKRSGIEQKYLDRLAKEFKNKHNNFVSEAYHDMKPPSYSYHGYEFIDLTLAPESLHRIHDYMAPAQLYERTGNVFSPEAWKQFNAHKEVTFKGDDMFALRPLDVVDLINIYMSTYAPPGKLARKFPKAAGKLQKDVFMSTKYGLLGMLGINPMATDPVTQAKMAQFNQVVEMIGDAFAHSEGAAKRALMQLRSQKKVTEYLLVPPHLYLFAAKHASAQSKFRLGVMKMKFKGHMLHSSLAKPQARYLLAQVTQAYQKMRKRVVCPEGVEPDPTKHLCTIGKAGFQELEKLFTKFKDLSVATESAKRAKRVKVELKMLKNKDRRSLYGQLRKGLKSVKLRKVNARKKNYAEDARAAYHRIKAGEKQLVAESVLKEVSKDHFGKQKSDVEGVNEELEGLNKKKAEEKKKVEVARDDEVADVTTKASEKAKLTEQKNEAADEVIAADKTSDADTDPPTPDAADGSSSGKTVDAADEVEATKDDTPSTPTKRTSDASVTVQQTETDTTSKASEKAKLAEEKANGEVVTVDDSKKETEEVKEMGEQEKMIRGHLTQLRSTAKVLREFAAKGNARAKAKLPQVEKAIARLQAHLDNNF